MIEVTQRLKIPSKNINNATVWDELIQLENKYSVTNDPLPPDYPLFKKKIIVC